jgi:parallel beta-helix repeat protein
MKPGLFVLVAATLVAVCCGGHPSSPTPPGEPVSPGNPTTPVNPGSPRTFFVSTNGSDDNDGSQESPWGTIKYAVARLRPGDTLYLRGGLYTNNEYQAVDSLRGTVPGGTSSSPITIAGYPGERVTIQPPQTAQVIRLASSAQSYLIFEDLTLDYSNNTTNLEGIYLSGGAHHNKFHRIELKYANGFGIVFSKSGGNSGFNEVIDCDIHDTGNGSGEPTIGHGAYVSTSDNVFRGNRIHDNQGYGLHFYDNDGALLVSRNVVQDNQIFNNGTRSAQTYGVVVAWGDNNRISGNSIYGNRGGVLVYTRSNGAQVSGNTIYSNNPLEGILIQGAVGTVLSNNTVYGNGAGNIIDLGERTVGQ